MVFFAVTFSITEILLVVLIIFGKQKNLSAPDADEKPHLLIEVKPQSFLVVIGIFLCVFCLGSMLWQFIGNSSADWAQTGMLAFCSLLAVLLILYAKRWSVTADHDILTYRTMFGNTYRCDAGQIQSVKVGSHRFTIRTNDRRMAGSFEAEDFERLLTWFEVHGVGITFHIPGRPTLIPLEQQRRALEALGIHPRENAGFKDYCPYFDHLQFCTQPYLFVLLLYTINELPGTPTKDIFCFPAELLRKQPETLSALFEQLNQLAKGTLAIERAEQESPKYLTVFRNGYPEEWQPDDSLPDEGGMLDWMNTLAAQAGRARFYILKANDWFLVTFLEPEKAAQLSTLCGQEWKPGSPRL